MSTEHQFTLDPVVTLYTVYTVDPVITPYTVYTVDPVVTPYPVHTVYPESVPDPGFMPSSIVAEISLGAGRPGMRAVVMTMSLSDTHFAIAVAWWKEQWRG
jgi:hypothetical protein